MQRGQQCRSPAHRRKCVWHREALGEHTREPMGEEASRPGPVLQGLVALTLNEMGDAGGF